MASLGPAAARQPQPRGLRVRLIFTSSSRFAIDELCRGPKAKTGPSGREATSQGKIYRPFTVVFSHIDRSPLVSVMAGLTSSQRDRCQLLPANHNHPRCTTTLSVAMSWHDAGRRRFFHPLSLLTLCRRSSHAPRRHNSRARPRNSIILTDPCCRGSHRRLTVTEIWQRNMGVEKLWTVSTHAACEAFVCSYGLSSFSSPRSSRSSSKTGSAALSRSINGHQSSALMQRKLFFPLVCFMVR